MAAMGQTEQAKPAKLSRALAALLSLRDIPPELIDVAVERDG